MKRIGFPTLGFRHAVWLDIERRQALEIIIYPERPSLRNPRRGIGLASICVLRLRCQVIYHSKRGGLQELSIGHGEEAFCILIDAGQGLPGVVDGPVDLDSELMLRGRGLGREHGPVEMGLDEIDIAW